MRYSVCSDNLVLSMISPVSIGWETPYLNVLFDKEKAREKLFVENNHEWQYTDMDDSFRTLNLNVFLDEDDHIMELSMYKYQQTSFHHGRNNVQELYVTASDRKKYLAVLQEVIVDSSEKEMEELFATLQRSDFGKERQIQIKKSGISLLDKDGNRQTVKRKTLLRAIQLSHEFLEILESEKLMREYLNDVSQETSPILREILSFVNTDHYYRIDELRKESAKRKVVAAVDESYPLLRQAVIDGDLEKVLQLSEFARFVPEVNPEGAPLYHAVISDRLDIAKILLKNGAYVLEMDKGGGRYLLEAAYLNSSRDMVRLLIAYHGAKSKTFSVTKHNTDNLLRVCAANKDYEVLEMMAPEAYTFDKGTWLSPEMFPDMNDDTVKAVSLCKGIRMSWGMDQILPVYEKNERELCKRMLLQGSTQEVVEYFIAQDDFEMFEASIQCHADLNQYGKYGPVFERGGKWCDTLAKRVLNFDLAQSSYFAKILNSGDIDRYLQIFEKRGGPFVGLEGSILWPGKIENPQKYIDLVYIFMRKGQPGLPGKNRYLFLEDIIRYFGDEQLAEKYYSMYPLNPDIDWREFVISNLMPQYIENSSIKNPYAGAEMLRSFFSQDIEKKEDKLHNYVNLLIGYSSCREPCEMIEDEADLNGREIRCLYMLRALLKSVTLQQIDTVFKNMYFAKLGIVSVYQYATSEGKNIRSKPFLKALAGEG